MSTLRAPVASPSSRTPTRAHGGPDARGAARWDFSTNVNAAGPCPAAEAALRTADATRYPDPSYQRLRERVAAWHGVAPARIVLAASASEFIQRVTVVGARLAPGAVEVPRHAYGDYAAAAQAHGRALCLSGQDGPRVGQRPTLRWCCDPSSPLGLDAPPPTDLGRCTTVLDAAYAPLRLQGRATWAGAARDAVFELISPNKALGLPGVRGAYAIAPREGGGPGADWVEALVAAEPSWPLGAHAVAMLETWVSDAAQHWLARQRDTLRAWKAELLAMLSEAGAVVWPSVTPFVCAQLPPGVTVAALREREIAVRDAGSFGLPGWVRLNALPPPALHALADAIGALRQPASSSTPPLAKGNA